MHEAYPHSPIRLHGLVLNRAQERLCLYLYETNYYSWISTGECLKWFVRCGDWPDYWRPAAAVATTVAGLVRLWLGGAVHSSYWCSVVRIPIITDVRHISMVLRAPDARQMLNLLYQISFKCSCYTGVTRTGWSEHLSGWRRKEDAWSRKNGNKWTKINKTGSNIVRKPISFLVLVASFNTTKESKSLLLKFDSVTNCVWREKIVVI
jgi:hypothetical protein